MSTSSVGLRKRIAHDVTVGSFEIDRTPVTNLGVLPSVKATASLLARSSGKTRR
jgi:hypothetical protein